MDRFYGGVFLAGSVAVQWYLEDSSYEPNKCQLTDDLAAHNDLVKKSWKKPVIPRVPISGLCRRVFLYNLLSLRMQMMSI